MQRVLSHGGIVQGSFPTGLMGFPSLFYLILNSNKFRCTLGTYSGRARQCRPCQHLSAANQQAPELPPVHT